MKEYSPPKTLSKLLWLGVDLDGTIAEALWSPDNPTDEIGPPIVENVAKLKRAVDKGYKIIIHTSRSWEFYTQVEYWLKFHGIKFKEIQMGKPLYYRYVDDRAVPADAEEWV